MRRFPVIFAAGIAALASVALAQSPSMGSGPYKVLKTVKVGGDGGFDYVEADAGARRLYVCRSGPTGRITVFDLDTLAPLGVVENASGHGAVVDPKTGNGFTTSKPITMFDSKTFQTIKKIDVQGNPDGILFDPYNNRVWDLSHAKPNATVIDPKDGSIAGTVDDMGGATEEGVTDGKGHLFFDIQDKGTIAAIDANTFQVTKTIDLQGKGGSCNGLAWDIKNHILFSACRNPQAMVIVNSDTGSIITVLPIGAGSDGAFFNPATMEAFSSNGDGTLTVVKESSPTSFAVEQTVQTQVSAKTATLDSKTGHIFLIAAEYGPPPAAQPGGPAPARGPMVADSFAIIEVGK
jgi:hypothetical protein